MFSCGKSRPRAFLKPAFMLACVACLVSVSLYYTGIYTRLGTRHNVWILPLILPVCGAMAADLYAFLSHRKKPVLAFVLAGMVALTDLGMRLDTGEYGTWQFGPWKEEKAVADRSGPRDMIVTGNDGINLMVNYYRYRSDDAVMTLKTPVSIAYGNTHMLMHPAYLKHFGFSPETLLQTMGAAQDGKLFEGIDHFIFVKTWTAEPFHALITCTELPKEILYLSPGTDGPVPADALAIIKVSNRPFWTMHLRPQATPGTALKSRHPNHDRLTQIAPVCRRMARRCPDAARLLPVHGRGGRLRFRR